MSITAGTSDTKSKRKTEINPLTSKHVVCLQKALDGANIDMQKVLHWVRTWFGRLAVAPNAGKDAVESGKQLDCFYIVEKVLFEVKKSVEVEGKVKKVKVAADVEEGGKKVKKMVEVEEAAKMTKRVMVEKELKDIVYVRDVSAFLLHIIHE